MTTPETDDGQNTPTDAATCLCGCGAAVTARFKYAGADRPERERHRAVGNRRRNRPDLARQKLLDQARAALPSLGITSDSLAHQIAQQLRVHTDMLGHLAVVVADELEHADVDALHDLEQRLNAEHNRAIADVQIELEEARSTRRALQLALHDERTGLVAMASTIAELRQLNEEAHGKLAQPHAEVVSLSTDLAAAQAALHEANATLLLATDGQSALQADLTLESCRRQDAEVAAVQALADLREEQLRGAGALLEAKLTHQADLRETLARSQRKADRERRSAVKAARQEVAAALG